VTLRRDSGQGLRRSSGQALRRGSGQAAGRPAGGAAHPGLPFDAASSPGPLVAYIDGGARGNPGPAGYGVRIERPDGELVEEFAQSIGVATNNVAEYRALIAGLEKAVELSIDELEVVSDSELLVKQMQGEYRVKNEALRELNDEANFLEKKLGRVRYKAVRREHNELADKLVNDALDAA